MTETTSVYIIACGDHVKIGISSNPESRLKAIKTGAPERPFIAATRPFQTRKQARAMELRLHRFFHRNRTNGEWFRIQASAAAKAMNKLVLHDEKTAGRVIAAAFERMLKEPELFN